MTILKDTSLAGLTNYTCANMKIFSSRNASSVIINGKSYSGSTIEIDGAGNVVVDGKISSPPQLGPITITVNGNVDQLETVGDVTVAGNVGSVRTVSGDVQCGDVTGNIQNVSGDVNCKAVAGNVTTVSGDITK